MKFSATPIEYRARRRRWVSIPRSAARDDRLSDAEIAALRSRKAI